MTTRECHAWLRTRRERLGAAPRPDLSAEDLIAVEGRRAERLGLWLTQTYTLPSRELDTADRYLICERLRFSERLLDTMLLPYAPCRVRDWDRPRRLWWLVHLTWVFVGVEEWRSRERLQAAAHPDFLAE